MSDDKYIDKIYLRAKDFGFSKDDIPSFVNDFVSSRNLGKDVNIYKYFWKYIKYHENKCKSISEFKNYRLKSLQRYAVNYMLTHRGLVLAFEPGVGKTLTAIITAHCLINQASIFGKKIKVLVVTPSSLIDNFKEQMIKYGLDPEAEEYVFTSITQFQIDYKNNKIDCKDTFLIVDEAHKLRTDYRKEFVDSDFFVKRNNVSRAEYAIRCASLCWKVLLLTATPFYNTIYDIVNLTAMIRGENPPITLSFFNLLEEKEKMFDQYFGCTFLFGKVDRIGYPEIIEKYINIEMTDDYYNYYSYLEKKLKGEAPWEDWENETVNTFMIQLRKATNLIEYKKYSSGFEYDDDLQNVELAIDDDDDDTITDLRNKDEFDDMDKDEKLIGYINKLVKDDKAGLCLKCDEIMKIVNLNKGENIVIYSFFIKAGINEVRNRLNKGNHKFQEITGSVKKEDRQKIVNIYNNPNNDNNILLISSAGSEGLDLKNTRHLILIDRSWNLQVDKQVIGRGARYLSHNSLPMNKRNVTVYYLLLRKPKRIVEKIERMETTEKYSVDYYLHLLSLDKQIQLDYYQQKLENIDIRNYDKLGKRCNEKLFLPDIRDIKNKILFGTKKLGFYELSNSYPLLFKFNDIEFPTVYHYYYFTKFNRKGDSDIDEKCREYANLILDQKTLKDVKILGKFRPIDPSKLVKKKNNRYITLDGIINDARFKGVYPVERWNNIKVDVMKRGLRMKFKREGMIDLLLNTGEKELIFHNKYDTFWGDGGDGGTNVGGKNMLGKLLMELRNEFNVKNI